MIKKLIIGILVLMVLLPGCIGHQTQTSPPDYSTKPSVTMPSKPTTNPDMNSTPTSEGTLLKIVGQIGGPTQAVAVEGNYAYVGVGARIEVLDISNPAALQKVGATEAFGGEVRDITVANGFAYVATGGRGFILLTSRLRVGQW